MSDQETFEVGGVVFPTSIADEWFSEKLSGVKCVTPAGATALVALYKLGHLPMKRKKPQEVPAEVLAYIVSHATLVAKAAERVARLAAEDLAHEHTVAHPEAVKESEFTYRLLDDIFIRHKGLGWRGSMDIGGILVNKMFFRYRSNSGKNQDHHVSFTWESSSGGAQTLEKSSRYEGNRRSDPERNWGLYE